MSLNFVSRRNFGVDLFNPGRLYNIGNVIAFAAGLLVAVAWRPASSGAGFWSAAFNQVLGTRSAVLMTAATVVFFASGEAYARASRRGTSPSLARSTTRLADLLSGVGSAVLAVALAYIGNPLLAAMSGVLSAGGKLGSACLGRRTIVTSRWERRLIGTCRIAPLLGRLPAAVAALGGFLSAGDTGDVPGGVLSVVMLGCCALWAAADALLIAGDRASVGPR